MSSGDGNPAAVATAPEDLFGDGRWMSVHKRFTQDAKEKEPEIVFIGDSIIAYLSYTNLWDKLFVPLHSINFGIGGERVENLLWRIENGEIDHMSPKAIVILIGTNNHGCTAEQVANGIEKVVDVCHEKQPHSEIIVLALLPRGENPNPLRERNAQVNEILLKKLPSKEKTHFLNVDPGIVQPNGTISHHDLWDYLHLTKSCYSKTFESVHEFLLQLLFTEDEKEEFGPIE